MRTKSTKKTKSTQNEQNKTQILWFLFIIGICWSTFDWCSKCGLKKLVLFAIAAKGYPTIWSPFIACSEWGPDKWGPHSLQTSCKKRSMKKCVYVIKILIGKPVKLNFVFVMTLASNM